LEIRNHGFLDLNEQSEDDFIIQERISMQMLTNENIPRDSEIKEQYLEANPQMTELSEAREEPTF